jgi:hypothetical protein
MSIDYILQSENFDKSPYEHFGSFNLLESHIRLSRGDAPIEVLDPRFETPYTTWKQLHACTTLRLTLWSLKPSDAKSHKFLQHVVYVVGRPITCILDAGIDLSLCVIKTLMCIDAVMCRFLQEIMVRFRLVESKSFIDLQAEFQLLLNSGRYFCYSWCRTFTQIADIALTIHFFGPRGGALWSYSARNLDTRQDELILDPSKVKFLREKCGWEGVTDEALKKLGNTWSLVNSLNGDTYSYRKATNRYYVQANFTINYGNYRVSYRTHN